jgi:hypothetical protein
MTAVQRSTGPPDIVVTPDAAVQGFPTQFILEPFMDNLLFANLPHNCKDDELRRWIEERGFEVNGLKVIRDVVSGSSPSFARVRLSQPVDENALRALDQQALGARRINVRRGRSPLDD